MTVTATYSPLYTAGDGVTTSFSAAWPIFAKTDIRVDLYNTSLGSLLSPAPALNGGGTYDYTVTLGSQDQNTGEYASATVVFNTAPPAVYRVIRQRQVAAQQPNQFQNNTAFPAPAVEQFGDRLAMSLQQSNAEASLFAIRIPFTDGLTASVTLPSAEIRAENLLGFDVGGGVTLVPTASSSAAAASLSAAAAELDAITAQAAASQAVSAVGGVKVTSNDTTAAPLATKLIAGEGASLEVNNPGANETYTISTVSFAAAVQMLFVMAAPPTGWTQVTTTDDAALRLVSGSGGGTAGSANFTSAFASRTPAGSITVNGTSLSTAQLASHGHSYTRPSGSASVMGCGGVGVVSTTVGDTTGSQGSGSSHDHTATFTGTALDFAVKYVDVIRATKD